MKKAALLFAVALSGCASLSATSMRVGTPPPNSPALRLSAPGMAPVEARTVVYQDRWETEAYQLWRGRKAQAEAIFMQATGIQIALEFPRYRLAKLTQGWHAVQTGGALHWQPEQHVNLRHRTVFYRRFQLGTGERACVAFESDWATAPDDPEQRPTKAFFGYYCRTGTGQALTDDQARRIAQSVHPPAKPPQLASHTGYNASALAKARHGVPSSRQAAGYPRFPLSFDRHYQVGDGSVEPGHS